MSRLSFITANRLGAVRSATLNGRKYVVAPVVMIKQGVLPGSNGSILYTNAAVNRRIERWNGMPLTLGHPEDENGAKVSARTPDVIDKYRIGEVYNASHSADKLRSEAWFDILLTENASPGLIAKIRKGSKIELSTGLFTNVVATNGKDPSGKDYTHELKGYEPDHLAVLLNEKGACSLADGCGVNTNAATIDEEGDAVLAVNSLSHSDISAAIRRLLEVKYAGEPEAKLTESDYYYPRPTVGAARIYVQDTYPDYVIFEMGPYSSCKTYRHDYSMTGETIKLTGDKVEVVSSRVHKKVAMSKSSLTFSANAKKGGANCCIGPGGFSGGNTCAKGGGGGSSRASKKAATTTHTLDGYPNVKISVFKAAKGYGGGASTGGRGFAGDDSGHPTSAAALTQARKVSKEKPNKLGYRRPTGNALGSFTAKLRRTPAIGLQLTANCGNTPCGPCAKKRKKIRNVDDLFTTT